MSLIRTIQQQVEFYLAAFPGDEIRLQTFLEQLAFAPSAILDRTTMAGHITASAFILSPAHDAALLIHHKALNRWLQPGGHFEGDPSLLAAALREAAEETGINRLRPLPIYGQIELPLDIDTHPIPARPSKNEAAHQHHDFTYLVHASLNEIPRLQVEEIAAARFVPLTEIASSENPRLRRLANKTQCLLSRS